jgi:hypothetical protein
MYVHEHFPLSGGGSACFAWSEYLTMKRQDLVLWEFRQNFCYPEWVFSSFYSASSKNYGDHHHWQNSHFWATAFLRRFCQTSLFVAIYTWIRPSGFHFLDFATIIFFYRARSSALRPTPNPEDQVSLFISPNNRVVQLYPQAPDSLFVTFYGSLGYRGGILTPVSHIPVLTGR